MKRTVRWLAVSLVGLLLIAGSGVASAGPITVQKISSDSYTNADTQHKTQVEPDTFAFGSTVIAAFASGRVVRGGGASNVDFARSTETTDA